MTLSSKHPQYADFADDWEQMRDTYRGQRAVKEKGFRYLPATSGMIEDGIVSVNDKGFLAYVAYKTRARFPGLVRKAVEAMLGVMHHKPPTIELPAKLDPMVERATLRNESLEMLLRRVNEEQLVTGRLGLLLEVPSGREGAALPYVALYHAESLINWDEGVRGETIPDSLNLVVIDESEDERQEDFKWERVEKYRVLVLGDLKDNEQRGTYRAGLFRGSDAEFDEASLVTPSIMGNTLDRLPFAFINTGDIVPEPSEPALIDVANTALAIYMAEADYRQTLFMQGQPTLVTIGSIDADGKPIRLGAGARIDLPMGGDAKFVAVPGESLAEVRIALENDYNRGDQKSGELIDSGSRERESGEALKVRVAAKTATLNQIALAGAAGLQHVLRAAAEWVGADPDEVVVTPNLDFVDDTMTGRELAELVAAKNMGAPISWETIHAIMEARGITALTIEDELEKMREEQANELLAPPSQNPDGPADDPETGEGDGEDPDGVEGGDGHDE